MVDPLSDEPSDIELTASPNLHLWHHLGRRAPYPKGARGALIPCQDNTRDLARHLCAQMTLGNMTFPYHPVSDPCSMLSDWMGRCSHTTTRHRFTRVPIDGI